jgi:hypothetical protein
MFDYLTIQHGEKKLITNCQIKLYKTLIELVHEQCVGMYIVIDQEHPKSWFGTGSTYRQIIGFDEPSATITYELYNGLNSPKRIPLSLLLYEIKKGYIWLSKIRRHTEIK